jgi:anti-sigma factor ChrR (cupin superfamily)
MNATNRDEFLELFSPEDREAFDASLLALAADIPPVDPPAYVRESLLGRLGTAPRRHPTLEQNRKAAGLLPEVQFAFREEAVFQYSHLTGVTARMLHLDPTTKRFSAVVKLEPGSRIPPHHHDGLEECLVLDGELIVGGVRMRAGDHQWAEAGSDHGEQWTDVGATLLLSGPMSLLAG